MEEGMKRISRLLALLSAIFGLALLVRSPRGRAGGCLWLPKLLAGAWAPFLALAGALGALIGLLRRDRAALVGGAFGAFAGVRHTVGVTRRRHDPFAAAFGRDWEQRIPPPLWVRLARPYQLIQPAKPFGPYQKNIDIGSASPLLCDLWLPPFETPRSRLGLVYLHGGWWQAADKDFLTRPLFGRLVNQGHVVMDLAYPLAPAADIYRMLDAVKHAIAWMKSHAAQLDLNPGRIALMGGSVGGGHLALLAAYTPNFPEFQPMGSTADTSVCGVISMYGVTDLADYFHEYGALNPGQPGSSSQITEAMRPRIYDRTPLDRLITRLRFLPAYRYSNMPGGPALLVDLLGGTLKEIPHAYELFSPLTHAGAHCPPTLQVFGDQDFAIEVSHGRRLHRALQAAGVPSVYIEFPETVHAFDQYFGVSRRAAPAAQMASNDIEQFLALLV
jgi:acetyl esterase/lipase